MAKVNEFWAVLVATFAIFLYRKATIGCGTLSWRFQDCLHRSLGYLAVLFQYYAVLLAALLPLAVRSLWCHSEHVSNMFLGMPSWHFLPASVGGFGAGPPPPSEAEDMPFLEVSTPLFRLCLIAPWAGFGAFVVVAYHVYKVVHHGLHKESFTTPGDGEYYSPLQKAAIFTDGPVHYVLLSVRARDAAHVALFPREVPMGPVGDVPAHSYELVLGRSETLLRCNVSGSMVGKAWETCSAEKTKDLWISVDEESGRVAAGWGQNIDEGAFVCHFDDNVIAPVNFGVKTSKGVVGEWHFNERAGELERERPPYYPNQKEDLMIMLLMLPAVFAVLAMKSYIRALEIFTIHREHVDRWDGLVTIVRADLALASAVEFVTIGSFGLLCMRLISARGEGPEIVSQDTVWWLTMNGVGAYVLVGVLRCFCVVIVLLQDVDAWLVFQAAHLADAVDLPLLATRFLESSKEVFVSSLVLLMWNMFFICRLDVIQAELPNANMKFNGVRMLVVIAQVQEELLLPPISTLPDERVDFYKQFNDLPFRAARISGYQGLLWHNALLCVECLAMVLFQLVVWSNTFDRLADRVWHKLGGLGLASVRTVRRSGYAPLGATPSSMK